MLLQQDLSINLLILLIILGFSGAFLDTSMGMGYGLLGPILIALGLDPLIVVPVLLISQMTTGFVGTFFHSIYRNVDLSATDTEDVKSTILFIGMGAIGMTLAVLLAINLKDTLLFLYIGILMIIAGLLMLPKKSFNFSWKRMLVLSGWASFNKAISGGGYGPIMTIGQMTSGRNARESVAVTDFSEAFLSGFGFLLYLICHQLYNINLLVTIELSIIMIISGILATPLGALVTKRLEKRNTKKIIGVLSIIIGVFTLIRFLLLL
jgi:uncharacterized membrane protein YfcA